MTFFVLPLATGLLAYATVAPQSIPALMLLGAETEDAHVEERCSPRSYLVAQLRREIEDRDVAPVDPAPYVRPELFALGQALAFDKILSGNRDISCMTCHHPDFATGDGRHLPLGSAGSGLGPDREGGPVIPRNAPPLFNLHAFDTMFWDSRVAIEAGGELKTPAGVELTPAMSAVFEFGVVSAQAMFPVTSPDEMRGRSGENEIADAPSLTEVWARLMARLGAIPAYRTMFEAAYPGQDFEDMTFAHAANAIAGFEIAAFESHNSPWESFLLGNDRALRTNQVQGALEYFRAGCHDCHSGPLFSDFEHHNTALAQFGPGKGDGTNGHDDFGRMRVSGDAADQYKFRTAPLLNVQLNGPYGHAGNFESLRRFVDHYHNASDSLISYRIRREVDRNERHLWPTLLDTTDAILVRIDPQVEDLQDFNSARIVHFLEALTDESGVDLGHTIPISVPSGLPVAD
jgi:cytochrome c peroxidase